MSTAIDPVAFSFGAFTVYWYGVIIAVQRDWIQSPGQTSINLPHRLLIGIVNENQEDLEVDVIVSKSRVLL